MKVLKEKVFGIIEVFGGEDWYYKFFSLVDKSECEKVEEVVVKVCFFLNMIFGFDRRLVLGKINDFVIVVDIKVGEVMSVVKYLNVDCLLVMNVNIGDRVIIVVINDFIVKEGNCVVVVLLLLVNFCGIVSEGMFFGVGEGVLKDVNGEIGGFLKGILFEVFNEMRNIVEVFLKG